MPKKPVKTKDDTERQEHILDLQRRAKEFVEDEMSFFESEQMSTELQSSRERIAPIPDAVDILKSANGARCPLPNFSSTSNLNAFLKI